MNTELGSGINVRVRGRYALGNSLFNVVFRVEAFG